MVRNETILFEMFFSRTIVFLQVIIYLVVHQVLGGLVIQKQHYKKLQIVKCFLLLSCKAKTDASLFYDLFSALADIDSIFKMSLQEKSKMIIYSCDIKYQISYWFFSHSPNHSNFPVHTHDSFYPIFLGCHSA